MADYYIGLMSGTSLDGIDAVLVDFDKKLPYLVAHHSHSFSLSLRQELLDTVNPSWRGSLKDIGTLHQKLGNIFAGATNQLLSKSNTTKHEVKAIGSHGHTLWHQPNGPHPFSMQLGDANLIAELTGITTVADFRSRDIAAGGQGAPLAPAFHSNFLTHSNKKRIILNIGGIANISILPPKGSNEKVIGFDTGPGNGLIDAWIKKHKSVNFDKNGDWGKSGQIIPELLSNFINEPFFSLPPPKSTGKEYFNLSWLQEKITTRLSSVKAVDIQATLTAFTAKTIADNCNNCDELIVCGGGVHNQYLMGLLGSFLPKVKILSSKTTGIDPDWMEAIAFAWLAKQTMHSKPNNLPAVTGAHGFKVLGAIYHK